MELRHLWSWTYSVMIFILYLADAQEKQSCTLVKNSSNASAIPDSGPTSEIWSCTPCNSANFEVHFLHVFGHIGIKTIHVQVQAERRTNIKLFLMNYLGVHWEVKNPSNVIIEDIVLASHDYPYSNVSVDGQPYRPFRLYSDTAIIQSAWYATKYAESTFGLLTSYTFILKTSSWILTVGTCISMPSTILLPTTTPTPEGSCLLTHDVLAAHGRPSFTGFYSTTLHSCAPCTRADFEVHVLSMRSPQGDTARDYTLSSKVPTVNIRIQADAVTKVKLMLNSFRAVNWNITKQSTVIIDDIIVLSRYSLYCDVSVSGESVQHRSYPEYFAHYRSTEEIKMYAEDKFGLMTSYTYADKVSSWTLTVGTCTSMPVVIPTSTTKVPDGVCSITSDYDAANAKPSLVRLPQDKLYSCAPCMSADYEVHVILYNYTFISIYDEVIFPNMNVEIHAAQLTKIKLVLITYPAANWVIRKPSIVTIEDIVLATSTDSYGDVTIEGAASSSFRVYRIGKDMMDSTNIVKYVKGEFGILSTYASMENLSPRSTSWTLTVGTCNIIPRFCIYSTDVKSASAKHTIEGLIKHTTYSCTPCVKSEFEVHVLNIYKPYGYKRGFNQSPDDIKTVLVNIEAESPTSIKLILLSYEPSHWLIRKGSNVTIIDIALVSQYITYSTITVEGESMFADFTSSNDYISGWVSSDQMLEYVKNKFGFLTSYTGVYETSNWTLTVGTCVEPICEYHIMKTFTKQH